MASQDALDATYMQCADSHAALSSAMRSQVGAVLALGTGVLVPGYNGLPKELGNVLEYTDEMGRLVTKPATIHAELNCILKCSRQGLSCAGAVMYVTLGPCVPCASMILSAGIKRLVYREPYRDTAGVDLLIAAGVQVDQLK